MKKANEAAAAAKVFISQDDCYLFGQGTHYDIYKKLGAHPSVEDGVEGMYFAVWAPNAERVNVVGTFNGWNEESHPLTRVGEVGIHAAFIPGVGTGELYKYLITARDGRKIYKADPYAGQAERRPGTASVTTDLSGFAWKDAKWQERKQQPTFASDPIAIYECHVGSWMRHPGTAPESIHGEEGFYTYREFADRLTEYLKGVKFTHVELMGILEHPFDGSWGYQVTGYYAPTSRYGGPKDFMYLVNKLHENGIGVILDWVPAHFCPDAHGLAEFDGTCIYEDADPRRGQHPDWGTRIFNFGKSEVKNFLIANVLYWMREFHVDGIRVDAVASMLYLDYGKKDGQWLPNQYGGNENLDAVEFFKHMNSVVRGACPGFLTIAEESTAWPGITGDIGTDKLGFTYKWNMGWMHDFCEYMKLDPIMRGGAHNMLTFAMSYNHAERYILPLSHDEVVHLKCSMLEKMPGYRVDKYANLRLGYLFQFGHAGKKLLFMGQEFGQEREWSEERELDWYMLEDPMNSGMLEFMKKLLDMYRRYPAMYTRDDGFAGFEWVNADDSYYSTYSFLRKSGVEGDKELLFVLNMTPMKREYYRVGVPCAGTYRLVLNTDDPAFGGFGEVAVKKTVRAKKGECDGRDYYLEFDLPQYGGLVFSFEPVL